MRPIFELRSKFNERAKTHIDTCKTQMAWLSGRKAAFSQKKTASTNDEEQQRVSETGVERQK